MDEATKGEDCWGTWWKSQTILVPVFRRLQFRNTETHFDVQNTCPKILKCFCFPKIWVIHLDKLYYIFYCLHSNNTCWLFFHIVDHYKVTDMFELFPHFYFYFLIYFQCGFVQMVNKWDIKSQFGSIICLYSIWNNE